MSLLYRQLSIILVIHNHTRNRINSTKISLKPATAYKCVFFHTIHKNRIAQGHFKTDKIYPHCPFPRRNSAFLAFAGSSVAMELGRAAPVRAAAEQGSVLSWNSINKCPNSFEFLQYNPEWLVKDFKQAPWACPETSTYLTCSFVHRIQKIKEFILGFLPGTTLPLTL